MIQLNKLRGKKGSMQDIVILISVLLALAISALIMKTVFFGITDAGMFDGVATAEEISNDVTESLFPTFDTMFFIIFVGATLGIAFLAFQIRTHPAFFWISSIFLTIMVWLSAVMSNVWERVHDAAALSAGAVDEGMTVLIMSNLPLFIMGAGALIMLVMYAINKGEGL